MPKVGVSTIPEASAREDSRLFVPSLGSAVPPEARAHARTRGAPITPPCRNLAVALTRCDLTRTPKSRGYCMVGLPVGFRASRADFAPALPIAARLFFAVPPLF